MSDRGGADLSINVGNLAAENHFTNTSADVMSRKWSPLGATVLRLSRYHPFLVQINLDVSVLLVWQAEDSLGIGVQSVYNVLQTTTTKQN